MSTKYRTKNGKNITLLNPSERARKFVNEIRSGKKITNDGEFKKDKKGKEIALDKDARAYRAGYLDARKDSAGIFKWKKKKGYLN